MSNYANENGTGLEQQVSSFSCFTTLSNSEESCFLKSEEMHVFE